MLRKLTHGALGDYAIPPWGERETWDEWLERIFHVPMKHWKTIHWKAAATALGTMLEDLKSEQRRPSDFMNAEATILKIAADSLQSSSSLIKKLDQQVDTLIRVKNTRDRSLATGRPEGLRVRKSRAATQRQIIEKEIGNLLRGPATAFKGNDWIADYIFKRQNDLGIKKSYSSSTIAGMTKTIAARIRRELRR